MNNEFIWRLPDAMAPVKVGSGQGQGCIVVLASLVEWGVLVGTVHITAQVDSDISN